MCALKGSDDPAPVPPGAVGNIGDDRLAIGVRAVVLSVRVAVVDLLGVVALPRIPKFSRRNAIIMVIGWNWVV